MRFLTRYFETRTLTPFSIYCVVAGLGSLAWVVNAYLIAFGGLLLLAGRLGDLASRRAVFLAGLVVFTIASSACGLASAVRRTPIQMPRRERSASGSGTARR